jgi:hypothetical protein
MTLFDVVSIVGILLVLGYLISILKDLFSKSLDAQTKSEAATASTISKAVEKVKTIGEKDIDVAQEVMGTRSYTTINFKKLVATNYFVELLKNRLGIVDLLRISSGDFEDRQIYSVIEDGVTHAIILNAMDYKSAKLTSEKFDVAEWVKDDRISLTDNIRLLLPHKECEEVCQASLLDLIKECVDLAEVTSVDSGRGPNRLNIFELYEIGGRLSFQRTSYTYSEMDSTLASLSFNPISIKLGDEAYSIPVGKVQEYFADELVSGRNVLMVGTTGTGKTSLISNILASVSKDPKQSIVKLDYSAIKLLTSPAGRSSLHSFLEQQKAVGVETVVFYVDEGQSVAESGVLTTLLELMDGLKIEGIKTSTIAAMNKPIAEIDPALRRPGRAHNLIELSLLKPHTITALAAWIEKNSDLVINHAALAELTKKGSATLAEVWGTFSPQTSVQKWKEKFYKYRATPNLRKVA